MCQPEGSYRGGPYIRLVHCVIALFVGMQGIPKEPGNIHWDNAPRDDLEVTTMTRSSRNNPCCNQPGCLL